MNCAKFVNLQLRCPNYAAPILGLLLLGGSPAGAPEVAVST
jgi:hypothetical protein